MTASSEVRDVLLADGRPARIRRLGTGDLDQVRDLYRRSSQQSRYLRFFSPVPPDTAVRFTPLTGDDTRHCVLGAEVDGRLVALGQYDAMDEPGVAEVAFLVEDAQQTRGIGTALLEALAQRAVARGIHRFHADYLRPNHQMPDVFAHSGFDVSWEHDDVDIGGVNLDLVPPAGWVRAHARRDDVAEARSIGRLLRPRSIAVVGASARPTSIGRAIVTNLVEGGFTGDVHPVNPHDATICGRRTHPTVVAIPGPVDLAVIAVPAAAVLEVAEQCAEKGVHGLVVISGGFAELEGGAAMQEQLTELCWRAGMRLVGPNCVGVVNTDPGVRMNATFSPVAPSVGRVGCASQSGGVGIELLSRAHALGLGVSTFVSMGNKADVSGNDLLQYWGNDPATDVVLLYLESMGNPRKFARIARDLARTKPVIALKSGRTTAGARGTRSHTAALADPDAAVDAILRQSGVIRVDTLESLFDVATLLAHQPVPAGRRVAVVSNGGGPAIVAADACIAAGLEVPELSPDLQAALRELVPTGGLANPVDLIASASGPVFERAATLLLESGEVDALLVIYVAPYVTSADDVAAAVAQAAERAGDVPIAACFLGLEEMPVHLGVPGSDRTVPTFAYPESAAGALAHAAWLGEWRRRPAGAVQSYAVDRERARARLADALADAPEGAWAPADVTFGLLADYGIPVVPTRYARSASEAASIARAVGFPVALKAAAPELVHKTDRGGVRLGLADERAVRTAFTAMEAGLGPAMGGAIVQPMAGPGVELIVGVNHDPTFGPVLVFGMGGFDAELQHDTALAIPPCTDTELDRLVRSLRGSPLLFGYRSSAPVAVDALCNLVGRVGLLAQDVDEIAELDCNPVIVSPGGALVVDAKLRLVARPRLAHPFELD
jgi:acetyl coenzyme A synthetase (ADP forming)-like protein